MKEPVVKLATELEKSQILSLGQRELYELVVSRIESDEPITMSDARELYIKHGCRDIRDGVPYMSPYRGSFEDISYSLDDFVPMDEPTIRSYSSAWLKLNLGSLVTKGFLKVIPVVNLKSIKAMHSNGEQQEDCTCILSGYAQTTNYCPVHTGQPMTHTTPKIDREELTRFFIDVLNADNNNIEKTAALLWKVDQLLSHSHLIEEITKEILEAEYVINPKTCPNGDVSRAMEAPEQVVGTIHMSLARRLKIISLLKRKA